MATTRLIPLHTGKGRTVAAAMKSILNYVENPEKTDGGRLISAYQCNPGLAASEFHYANQLYRSMYSNRPRGRDVIAYQIRQSFAPGEITPEEANRLGCELAKRFTKGKHAYVVCTHVDKHHAHNHVIFCSIRLDHSKKFRDFLGSGRALRRLNDTICIENGYSIVEMPQRHGQSYNRWLGDRKKLSQREKIQLAIDAALKEKPESFDAFLKLLRDSGFEVKGKENPSIMAPGQKRFARMDTLGAGYSASEIRTVIAGEKEHTPHLERAVPQQKQNKLLIDIQAKLNAGKGVGYERWARLYNLKQMAQTMIYLQEHDLTEFDVLIAKADAAVSHCKTLNEQIKAAEAEIAEIRKLRGQIVNYLRTKDIYAAYRKAGYSKKFLAEHEPDIIICKAAKRYFDEHGLTKLPSFQRLRQEESERNAALGGLWAEYRKAKTERKELLTAKANVQQFFNLDLDIPEQKTSSKKERFVTQAI